MCADLNLAAAEKTAREINDAVGSAVAISMEVRSHPRVPGRWGSTLTPAAPSRSQVNVANPQAVEGMFALTEKALGGVHVIFNNAGLMHGADDDAVNTDEDIWDLTMDVNVKGARAAAAARRPLRLADGSCRGRPHLGACAPCFTGVWFGCKYGIPALRRSGGGSIINTASFVSCRGAATPQLAYTSSKGAVLAMSRELAVIHAREGIRVNALCPGPLNTPLLQDFLDSEDKKQRRLVHVPMGRFGEAAEMAKAALFLASSDSSYVTGTDFLVDGGICAAYVTSEAQVDPFGGPTDLD